MRVSSRVPIVTSVPETRVVPGANRDLVHVLRRLHGRDLAVGEVVVLGQLRCVDEGDAVVTGRREESLQRAQREDLRAGSGELTQVVDLEVGRLAVEQSPDEAAEDFGETHEGANGVGDLAGRDVDRVRHEVARERQLRPVRRS